MGAFWEQVRTGRITKEKLQAFLDEEDRPSEEGSSEAPAILNNVVFGISVPGTHHFDVAEKFEKGQHADGLYIIGVGKEFRECFFDKVEEDVPDANIVPYELAQESHDSAIITALGGEGNAEVQLAHVHELMRYTQMKARKDAFLKEGANLFYARERYGVLRVVVVDWDPENCMWAVSTYSRKHSVPWERGHRILAPESRDARTSHATYFDLIPSS